MKLANASSVRVANDTTALGARGACLELILERIREGSGFGIKIPLFHDQDFELSVFHRRQEKPEGHLATCASDGAEGLARLRGVKRRALAAQDITLRVADVVLNPACREVLRGEESGSR
jgi:hypothetical protein